MPFTFSHPAIVLPLAYLPKKWFSLTGLIIGSLTPDFEYFLRMSIKSNYSHTIGGLFWFDLPLGIVLAFIFHNIVRNTLFDNLPIFFKSRCIVFKQFNWNGYFKRNYLVVIISILIGASSHLLWDSFTHDQGYFVQRFSVLSNTVDCWGNSIPILKILQHTSSIIGGLFIAFVFCRLPKAKSVTKHINLKYWIVFVIFVLIVIALRFFYGLDINQYGNVIVTGISATMISLILTSLILRKNQHLRRQLE